MIRRTLLACFAFLLAAVPARAQQPAILPDPAAAPIGEARLVARLPAPGGTRAAWGALSPEGGRYAFGVMSGDSLQLWMLDVHTRAARRLTPGGHRRHDPRWSPDGTRLAYWGKVGDRDGIFVLDLASGRERSVWSDTSLTQFGHTPRWLGNDSIVFSWADVLANAPDQPWIVSAAGGPARRTGWPSLEDRRRRDDPRGTPYFGACCGGARQALWLRPPDGPARCLAGPVGSHRDEAAWSSGLLAFPASTRSQDTLMALYAADPARPGARTVRAPERIGSLSSSDAGDLALLVHPRPEGPSELWMIPAGRLRADPGGDTLAACPEPPAEIGAFLQARQVPAVRSVTVLLEDPAERLAFFAVSYGGQMDWNLWQSGRGVAFRGRVGWLERNGVPPGEPLPDAFDIHPGDDVLWSRPLLARLEGTNLGRLWMIRLLADPDLPDTALAMLVDSAARAGSVELARLLLGTPRVRADHRWLARLGEVPWPDGADPSRDLLWPVALQAIADPRTPEPVLYAIASQLPNLRGGRNDSTVVPVARALEASPTARRSARILQRLAVLQRLDADGASIRRAATERLLVHPQATDSVLLPVVRMLARDSAWTRRLVDEPAVRRSALLTAHVAWSYAPPDVLARARDRVLADSAAPAAALEALGWMIRHAADDDPVAARILSHPAARSHGPLLAAFLRERRLSSQSPLTRRIAGQLAAVLRDPAADERTLFRIASALQESAATPLAMLLLDHPRARRCAPTLERMAQMVEIHYSPPTGPHVPDPPASAVRARAEQRMAELQAAGPPPPCDVGPTGPELQLMTW